MGLEFISLIRKKILLRLVHLQNRRKSHAKTKKQRGFDDCSYDEL